MSPRKVLICQLMIVLSFLTIVIKTDECNDLLQSYLKNINPSDDNNPFSNMGTGFNDLGKYEACLRNPDNKFVTLRIVVEIENPKPAKLPVFMGVCLPEKCMNELFYDELKNFISSKFGVPKEKIETIEAEKENNKYKGWSVSSVIIFIIIFVYLVFASGLVKFTYDFFILRKYREVILTTEYTKTENQEISLEDGFRTSSEARVSDSSNFSGRDEKKLLFSDGKINAGCPPTRIVIDQEKVPVYNLTTENIPKSKFYFVLEKLFDVTKNFSSIFQTRETDDNELKIFDGLRVITCSIIIMDHIVSYVTELPVRNPLGVMDVLFKEFKWQFFSNSYYTVDVFFAISGFFLAYVSLKNIATFQKAKIVQILMNIALRLLRIWPVYFVLFLIYYKFFIYVIDGPIGGYVYNKEIDNCDLQWPFIFTLLSNFTFGMWEKAYPYCYGWTWYIPNDFQFCVLGIFLLYSYAKNKKIFYILFSLVSIVCLSVEAWLIIDLDLGVNMLDYNSTPVHFDKFYMKFYTRISPFLIGLLIGIIYSNYKKDVANNTFSKVRLFFENLKDSKMMAITVYLIGLSLILIITFSTYWSYDTKWPFFWRFVYNFFGKKVYVIGLFMLCFPLMAGHFYILGGWMGSNFFLPLAKLSFAAYLIHPLLIKYIIYNTRYALYLSGNYFIFYGFSFVLASYVSAIFIYTLLEMPFQNVRELFKKRARAPVSSKKNVLFE